MSDDNKKRKLYEAFVVVAVLIVFIIVIYYVAKYLRKWIKPKKAESAFNYSDCH